jgi:hypothetical protein
MRRNANVVSRKSTVESQRALRCNDFAETVHHVLIIRQPDIANGEHGIATTTHFVW